MSDLLDKLSSYNIFNYLLPGALFAVIADAYSSYSFVHEDVLVAAFVYYFLGLVISRIGSIFIEPILIKIGFFEFTDYKKFIEASKIDEKIEVLSEANNMYRTLCSLFFTLIGFFIFNKFSAAFPLLKTGAPFIASILLMLLFLFSYRKQTNYIVKRVDVACNRQE